MIYVIQNRIVWVVYDDRDSGWSFGKWIFPSVRNEHREPVIVIRLGARRL
ncbi:MAG: hypothetical protein II859_08690 [Bacteroidales bacterium]|nr:hypothetical protein [Bacteroidales bacterium]